MRPHKFDDAQAIEAYHSSGRSTLRAAALLGVWPSAVQARLRKLGVPMRSGRPERHEEPPVETYQQTRARRRRGAKNAAAHRASQVAIGRCINEYGLEHAVPEINRKTGRPFTKCRACRDTHAGRSQETTP